MLLLPILVPLAVYLIVELWLSWTWARQVKKWKEENHRGYRTYW